MRCGRAARHSPPCHLTSSLTRPVHPLLAPFGHSSHPFHLTSFSPPEAGPSGRSEKSEMDGMGGGVSEVSRPRSLVGLCSLRFVASSFGSSSYGRNRADEVRVWRGCAPRRRSVPSVILPSVTSSRPFASRRNRAKEVTAFHSFPSSLRSGVSLPFTRFPCRYATLSTLIPSETGASEGSATRRRRDGKRVESA